MMERRTGTKNVNGNPHIDSIDPVCALPGGEIRISGSGLRPRELRRPRVRFGDVDGSIVISSEQFIVARVPEGAASGEVVVATNGHKSNPGEVRVGVPIAENLHPVANPAIDQDGNVYVTFSGSRGQKAPVAIYRINNHYNVKPFVHEMMNADPHLAWIALVTIGCDHDFTGSGAFGHAGHNELFRTDDDGTIYVAESHLRPAQFPGPEPTAANANLASRQSAPGIDGIDMGFAVYVFWARSSFHHLSISFLTHAVACLALSVSLQSEAAADR